MQKYDDIITKKDIEKKELPKELENLKKNVKETESQKNEAKKKLDNNLKEQKKYELEISKNKDNIKKYNGQLIDIKTNKEYKALNSEISTLKEKNVKIDDKLIELMEKENDLREDLKEKTEEWKKAKKELKDNEDRIKKEIEKVEKKADELRNKRNTIAKELPKRLIKRYVSLIKYKNRKAVVFNENNACSGCGFKIRPQMAIEVSKNNKYIACENCGRIVVDKEFANSINIDE